MIYHVDRRAGRSENGQKMSQDMAVHGGMQLRVVISIFRVF